MTSSPSGATEGPVFIRCDIVSYPVASFIELYDGSTAVTGITLTKSIDSNLRSQTFDYEANITYTSTDCPKLFQCQARAAGINSFANIGICQTSK